MVSFIHGFGCIQNQTKAFLARANLNSCFRSEKHFWIICQIVKKDSSPTFTPLKPTAVSSAHPPNLSFISQHKWINGIIDNMSDEIDKRKAPH